MTMKTTTTTTHPRAASRRGVGLGAGVTLLLVTSFLTRPSAALLDVVPLPYAAEAYKGIDAETMTLHHGKHYAGYVSKYNAAVNASSASAAVVATTPLPVALSLVGSLSSADLDAAVRNQGGGAWNHALFWKTLAPQGSAPTRYNSAASSQLKAAVDEYGGLALLNAELAKQAGGVFGSGWAWLCAAVSPYGATKRPSAVGAPLAPPRLSVMTSPNQDSPLTGMAAADKGSAERCVPLAGVDVWEHAYYLKHRNVRADYVAALLGNGTTGTGGMINWAVVSSNYARVVKASEKGTDAALLEAAGAIGQA